MRYRDIMIRSWDQEFIDNLSDQYGIDYEQAEIYLNPNWETDITNQLIYYILSEAVYEMDLEDYHEDDIKDMIRESIYTNCIDSWFDINIDTIKNSYELSEDDIEAIEDLIN
jgi:hypothetical protein